MAYSDYKDASTLLDTCEADPTAPVGKGADCRFVGQSEFGTTAVVNRPHLALAENSDILKERLDETRVMFGILRMLNLTRHVDMTNDSGFDAKSFSLEPAAGSVLSDWCIVGDDGSTARWANRDSTPVEPSATPPTWTTGTFTPACDKMQDVHWADSVSHTGHVACGRVSGAGAALFTSTNGSTWTNRSTELGMTGVGNIANVVLYDDVNDSWVVGGENTSTPAGWVRIVSDPDTSWAAPTTLPANIESITHMAYNGNGVLMACGRKTGTPDKGIVIRSTDGGDNWTEVLEAATNPTEFDFIAYSAHHDRWVADDGDYPHYSDDADGTSWSTGTTHSSSNSAIAFDEHGVLWAIGGGAWIDYSLDLGVTWEHFFYLQSGSTAKYFSSSAPNCLKLLGGVFLLGEQGDSFSRSLFAGSFGQHYA